MGVSSASGVVGAGLVLVFFLVLDAGGCSVMCAGIGAVTDFGVYIAAGVVFVEVGVVAFVEADVIAFVETGVVTFAGEAVVGLSSAFWGDFFFFRVTSTHSSTVFGWAWSGSFSFLVSLMVTMEAVVAAVSVATVAAAAAGAFDGSFWGQNLDMCPNCLQLQQRGRLPSTITIICLPLLMMISGIV